jgi:hypothetical protein
VQRRGSTDVAVPEHIKQGTSRGNEEVSLSDVVIPRLEIAQALSPCLQKNKPEYIEGCEQGMLFNSVTRRVYGANVVVCPVFFRKEYLVWKDRKAGGGFRGAYSTLEEANARIAQEEEAKYFTANDTAQQFSLIVDQETGETEEIVISMSRTKLKVSRNWNALIRINGNDRFSRVYNVFTVEDSTDKGDFWNYSVQTLAFTPLAVYRQAEALYNAIEAGSKRVVADTTGYDEGETIDQASAKDY